MSHLWKLYPSATGNMQPENIPGYQGLRIHPTTSQPTCASSNIGLPDTSENTIYIADTVLLSAIQYDNYSSYHFILQMVPTPTGYLTCDEQCTCSFLSLCKHSTALIDSSLIRYFSAVYGFNSGFFSPTTSRHCLSFEVVIVADTRDPGRSLLKKIKQCPTITASESDLIFCFK